MRQITVGDFRVTPLMRGMVNEVLDTGRISYGPYSRTFESDFAKLHGCKYGVLSNSGTSSLHVALQTLKELHGWEDGDEVIVPATTFVATVNVVLHNRMKPVLVDVDPLTYNMDYRELEKKIDIKTRCVIPVHLFGQPADMNGIRWKISDWNKYNVAWHPQLMTRIIEDSCECMFASHNAQSEMVGSMGDIGCFSTYVAHLITTGVGGIATTNNPEYAKKMRSLVNHGRDGIYISIDDDNTVSQEILSRRFNFESIGHSFRITELEAALGVAQLETWQDMILSRKRNANYLTELLSDLQDRIQLPIVDPGNSHSWMMYPIVLRGENNAELRDKLCLYLEKKGIETRGALPLIRQPAYKGLWNPGDYPVADWLWHNGFYVGCHQHISLEDLEYMSEVIYDFFKEN